MGYFWIIFVAVIIVAAIFQFIESEKEKKKRGDIFSNLADFEATDKYVSQNAGISVAFDSKRKKVAFLSKTCETVFYSYKDILTSEIEIDGETTTITKTKKSTTSVVGRALIGGILTGGIGAVIGGLTGKSSSSSKQKDKIRSINLKITVNDLSNPIHKINFLNIVTKKGSFIYKVANEQVEKWHGIFSVLINQGNNE